MAEKHVLDMVMSSSHPAMCAFGVQLQGSYFGVLVQQDSASGDYDNVMVWNWRTGDLEFVSGLCSGIGTSDLLLQIENGRYQVFL